MTGSAKRRKTKNSGGSAESSSSKNVVAEMRRGKSRAKSSSWDSIGSIIGAIVIFLLIRTLLVEAFHIPSGSMEPTLLVGDFLFVNKAVYGAHIPLTNINLPSFSDPQRGSVAIYESPSQARLRPELRIKNDLTPTVVKRLVGVPGDTLYMRDGLLYVNGIAQRQGFGMGMKPLGWTDEVDPSFDWQKP
jgi:signal peptidase I